MTERGDPTTSMRELAATFPSVIVGSSCNQTSFKVGKNAFLYLGPGPKGKGFKAMFKLDSSMNEARKLAVEEPDRFEVGATTWVTTRFSEETAPQDNLACLAARVLRAERRHGIECWQVSPEHGLLARSVGCGSCGFDGGLVGGRGRRSLGGG